MVMAFTIKFRTYAKKDVPLFTPLSVGN